MWESSGRRNKDACVLYRSAASRKCPFVSFYPFLHFKWDLVNVSFQNSRFHHFLYTSCCHFNEASSFPRVWEQSLFDDLSEQMPSSPNISLNETLYPTVNFLFKMPVCQLLQTNKQGVPSPSSQRAPVEPHTPWEFLGNSSQEGFHQRSGPWMQGSSPTPHILLSRNECGQEHGMTMPISPPNPSGHRCKHRAQYKQANKYHIGCCRQTGEALEKPQHQARAIVQKTHPWAQYK